MEESVHEAVTCFPQIGFLFELLGSAPGYASKAAWPIAAIMSVSLFVCPHAPKPVS